ncbi:hypothetical protein ACLOJK_026700 [Asimina triloba]
MNTRKKRITESETYFAFGKDEAVERRDVLELKPERAPRIDLERQQGGLRDFPRQNAASGSKKIMLSLSDRLLNPLEETFIAFRRRNGVAGLREWALGKWEAGMLRVGTECGEVWVLRIGIEGEIVVLEEEIVVEVVVEGKIGVLAVLWAEIVVLE